MLLELKVIADVGLVGFPNVGKSTFLSRVTNARPKIANYHFTTLNPNLGVVDLDGAEGFVIADIPGIIEGASEGVGLGHEFLRHIERTRVLVHIVDAAGVEGRDPIDDIRKIQSELKAYDPELLDRPQVIAESAIDALNRFSKQVSEGWENLEMVCLLENGESVFYWELTAAGVKYYDNQTHHYPKEENVLHHFLQALMQ